VLEYIAENNKVELNDLYSHFKKKWACSNTIITNILKKLGRENVIKIENTQISITDEWVLTQKKLS
jgi:hypothetical protein